MVWIGMFLGSTVGGYVPSLWGADVFSASSILFPAIGAILGTWAGFRLSQ